MVSKKTLHLRKANSSRIWKNQNEEILKSVLSHKLLQEKLEGLIGKPSVKLKQEENIAPNTKTSQKPKRTSHKNKDLFKPYNPQAPGELSTNHIKSWQIFLEEKKNNLLAPDLDKEKIALIFQEFKNSEHFIKDHAIDKSTVNKPKEHIISPLAPATKLTEVSTYFQGIIKCIQSNDSEIIMNFYDNYIKGDYNKFLPFFTNQNIKELISVCRKKIEDKNTPKQIRQTLKTFLKSLQPAIERRGVSACKDIGHNDWFKWPTTDIFLSFKNNSSNPFKYDEIGFLKNLGYETGQIYGKTKKIDMKYSGKLLNIKYQKIYLLQIGGSPVQQYV